MSVSKIIQNNNGVAPQQVEATLHFDRLNDFNLSFDHATSFDFSKVVPVGHERTVSKDVFNLNTSVNLLGNSTPNPILSNIRQVVDTYRVPFQAIYEDWEEAIGIYHSKGDQCPVDSRAYFNPSLLWQSLFPVVDGIDKFMGVDVMVFARYVLVLSSIFGRDSILNNFNIHISKGLSYINYDDAQLPEDAPSDVFYQILYSLYDFLIGYFGMSVEASIDFTFGDDTVQYGLIPQSNLPNQISSFFQFVELILSSSSASCGVSLSVVEDPSLARLFNGLSWRGYSADVNIEPVIAYQMILADKFSNAKVDNIFTARMYSDALRQMVSYWNLNSPLSSSYVLNGKRYFYEPYSNRVISDVSGGFLNIVNDSFITFKSNYFLSMFSFGRPLRYGDYFTGSRLAPLAPGNTRVTVQNGEVDAVDINKREWLYSFLYNLNISTSDFRDYIRGIFGANIKSSRSDIIRLVRKERYLGKESVENTGAAQFEYVGSGKLPMSSILRGGASDVALMYHSTEPCLLLTLVWHDARVFRSNSVAKDSQIKTVLDEYIPELEFMGDQMILGYELDGSRNFSNVFGWNQRYAEYKMHVSYVSGAFLDDYANGMLLTDSGYSSNNGPLELSSTFIRQSIQDYERFFGNTRFGLQAVHAYAIVNFNTNAKRPMYINPQPMR